MPAATFARRLIVRLSRLLKKSDSCFDRLSTNGKSPTTSSLPPFALSLSKGDRRVFQHPVRVSLPQGRQLFHAPPLHFSPPPLENAYSLCHHLPQRLRGPQAHRTVLVAQGSNQRSEHLRMACGRFPHLP